MSDKMREEFEAHYAEEFSVVRGYKPSPEEMVSMRDGDGYGSDRHYLNGYWKGWKASRESLVIELPIPKELCGPDGSYMEYFEPEQIERCIEAAGLKVKP